MTGGRSSGPGRRAPTVWDVSEAFRMLEEGVDLVGLDTRRSILRYLHATLGELYRPSAGLEKLVAEGRLGKKVGKGVYDYKEGGGLK